MKRILRLPVISRIAVEGDGSVLVCDNRNDRVVRWREGATAGEVVAGGNGRGDRLDQLSSPDAIVVERDGSLLVSDLHNYRVVRWRKGAAMGEVVAGGNGEGNRLPAYGTQTPF